MSQIIFDDIIPSSTSGTQLATLLNDFKDTMVSGLSGSVSRPANLQENGYWIKFNDPDDGILTYYLYDGTQDIEVFQINKTTASVIYGSQSDEFSIIKNSDDALGPLLKLEKGRIAGGGQAVANDVIGEVEFIGQDASSVKYTQAKIRGITIDDVTSGTRGSEIAFYVTEDNGSALLEAIRITNDKKLGVNTTSPSMAIEAVANDSTAGIKATVQIDSSTGPSIVAHKERVATNGQVLNADTLGTFKATSTDQNGAEISGVAIEATALENHTDVAGGTKLIIQRVKVGETALTDIVEIDESGVTVNDDMIVTGDFTVQGTTTTIDTANLLVEDNNITVNNNGDDASSEGAGLTIERTGTDGSIVYQDSLNSKFKLGPLGSESEVITAGGTQTLSGTKTFADLISNNGEIRTPSRLDVKQDTYANLVTYASTAANGQLCFATDQKKMYQVIDSSLAEVGGGSAGDADTIHLIRADGLNNISDVDLTGSNADFDGGGTITPSSLTISTTAADLLVGESVIKYSPGADGQLDYFGFTKAIPVGQRGKELGFPFNYKTSSTTTDGDFRFCVKIKDGGNAGDISYYDMAAFSNSDNTGTIFPIGSFIPLDCTEVEFGFQNTTATTTVGLHVDNILVSQSAFAYKNMFNLEEWEAFTPTGSWVANSTYTGFKRRVGDSVEVQVNVALSGAPTSTNLTIDMPSGLVMDTAKMASANAGFDSSLGIGSTWDNGVGAFNLRVGYGSSTTVTVSAHAASTAGKWLYVTQAYPFTYANTDVVAVKFKVPVVGWAAQTEHVVTPSTAPRIYSEASGDFTVSATDWTTVFSEILYYIDSSGSHRIKGNINGTLSTTAAAISVTLSGVTFKTTTGNNMHSVASTLLEEGISWRGPYRSYASQGSNTLIFQAASSNFDVIAISFDVPLDSKPTWADPVSAQYLAATPHNLVQIIKDVKADTTAGGTFTQAAWQTRTLNTLQGDSVATLSSNQFILPPGKYLIDGDAPAYGVGLHQSRLADITNTAYYYGSSTASPSGTSSQNISFVKAVIEITDSTTYELQHYCATTRSTNGFGQATSFGGEEVYSQIKITKVW